MAGSSGDDQRSDKYRSFLYDEGEKNTHWNFGAPPNYDVVNKLFEEGRTKVNALSNTPRARGFCNGNRLPAVGVDNS